MNQVSKITNIVLGMVLSELAGLWLDNQLGTRFLVFDVSALVRLVFSERDPHQGLILPDMRAKIA